MKRKDLFFVCTIIVIYIISGGMIAGSYLVKQEELLGKIAFLGETLVKNEQPLDEALEEQNGITEEALDSNRQTPEEMPDGDEWSL